MKVSLNLLQQYVDLSGITPEAIANKLTFAGLEVEAITPLAIGDQLVIGEVLTCTPHPDSSHLHVLEVNLGAKYGHKQIVCGAPNARAGIKVIVARVGAKLAQNLTISASSIRGVTSEGMCCSLNELGVDPKYLTAAQVDGIEELPAAAPVGEEAVLTYLGLDDHILEVKILANRPDAQAVLNLARELAGLFERPFKMPKVTALPSAPVEVKVTSSTWRCPQFALRTVRGVQVAPSPLWLQRYLMASGIRSINNLVDIGNFVMLLTGQPLHMYDLDKLPSPNFNVRDDLEVPAWVALDGQSYQVAPDDIAITVDGQIMCLGGVMGAASSAIDQTTKNLAIEAAYFHPASIRRTSTRLNLVSDSSQRFAKGINPDQTAFVLELALSLLAQLAGAKTAAPIVNFDQLEHQIKHITTSVEALNLRLGTDFTREEIVAALAQVGINVSGKGASIIATIPPQRIDIGGAADLAEEVIRVLGFARVQSRLPQLVPNLGVYTERQQKIVDTRQLLRFNGLHEILTYTLLNREDSQLFAGWQIGEPLALLHPLTPDHSHVRTSLLASLLDTIRYNTARQMSDFGVFEISQVSSSSHKRTHLALGLSGLNRLQGHLKTRPYDYYDAKGYLEAVLDLLAISESRYQFHPLPDGRFPELHPGRSAGLYLGEQLVGIVGELHPTISKRYDFGKTPVVVAECDLGALVDLKTSPVKAKPIDKFPLVIRDLALIVSEVHPASEIIKVINKAGKKFLKQVEIFDVYSGAGVETGMKSLALHLAFGAADHTLTDGEVQQVLVLILEALNKNFSARVRQ